jgi:hypothetical protein
MGGSWELRLGIGTRSLAGVELAYTGSAHDVATSGLDVDAYAIRNGVEGAVRLNAPLVMRRWTLAPFALLGLGWARYDLVNAAVNTSTVRGHDNVLVVPLGVGVGASFHGFMADARFTYRAAFDDQFLGRGVDLHTWTVGANVGREF